MANSAQIMHITKDVELRVQSIAATSTTHLVFACLFVQAAASVTMVTTSTHKVFA